MNNINDNIDELLTEFAFEELNSEQRKSILSEMTEQEYGVMRQATLNAKSLNNSLPALPEELHQQLRQRLRQRHAVSSQKVSIHWLTSLLGMLVGTLMTVGWFYMNNIDEQKPVPITQSIVMTDTVFIHQKDTVYIKVKSEPHIVTREVVKYVERESVPPTSKITTLALSLQNPPLTNNLREKTVQGSYFNNIDLSDIMLGKMGKTIGEEAELMDLLTEMPSDGLDR